MIEQARRNTTSQPCPESSRLQAAAARHLELIRNRPNPGGSRLDETSWAILLDLFSHMERGGISLSKASVCVTAPPTTALRRIYGLIARGLVEKRPDCDDLRRTFLILTPEGYGLVSQWLQGTPSD